MKVQWTEQLVATQQQKTESIKKETEQIKVCSFLQLLLLTKFTFQAVADANRQKAVLEIKIQERLIEKEGEKEASEINNQIQMVKWIYFEASTNHQIQAAENTKADIEKYALEQEARANEALYSDKLVYCLYLSSTFLTFWLILIKSYFRYIKLNLAKALSNNTKFYFSGQQSELGSLFTKILGN